MLIADAIVPVALVVALGYVLTRTGIFPREGIPALARFVVKVALPFLIFANIAAVDVTEVVNPGYLAVYAIVYALMMLLGVGYSRLASRSRHRGIFLGLGMSATNNGFMGYPIFLILLPDWAGVAIGMAMIIDNVIIIPVSLFLAERAAGGGTSAGEQIRRALRNLITHPLVIAVLGAILVSVSGWELPGVLASVTRMLGETASGVALFTIGGMLLGLDWRSTGRDTAVAVVGKLVVAPALALGLALLMPGMDATSMAAVVILCALPAFSILPSLALDYGEEEFCAGAVMAQTLVSFATLAAWIGVVGALGWL
ncbi:AEC family transporter [Corynebacterium guangdongense]|uniref:Permease n=1 Tax=Corynebacterium guangdongense TaxID=1783348 RepID=A0ABU1ZZS1_9CORY|nr:AEC family transporter [Corynebacterium guangdongense]MDR7330426.1 putative permease [Corynebacterium guangdongense]WJZ18984.1 putative transporter YfdV [Corynebacterium guangdongense]